MADVPAGARRVVYIDDDEEYGFLFKSVLTRLGYDVTAHVDPRVALRELGPDKADVLITDFRMPGMDGAAVVRDALRRNPALVCAVVSSDPVALEGREAEAAGARAMLRKPENLAQFAEMMQRLQV